MPNLLKGGYSNRVYREGSSVRKKYTTKFQVESCNSRMRREINALRYYSGNDSVPVPKVYEVNKKELALVMEFIDGFPSDDYVLTRDADIGKEILFSAGRILKNIHSKRIPYSPFWKKHIQRKLVIPPVCVPILENEGIDPKVVQNALDSLVDWVEIEKFGISFIHGDYWLNNLLLNTDDKIIGVIDWENSGYGSPMEDFGSAQLWIGDRHDNFNRFWEGYEQTPTTRTVTAFRLSNNLAKLSKINLDTWLKVKGNKDNSFIIRINSIKRILNEI